MSSGLRVLHFAHGITSYNNSLCELARRLHAAGMTLCVASHNDLSPVLQDAPCEFHHLTQFERLALWQEQERRQKPASRLPFSILSSIASNRRYRSASLQGHEVMDLLYSWQPDLLLIDMECHVAILQTRQSGLPCVLCSRWFSVFKSVDLPPMHTTLLPPGNALQAWRIRASWASLALYRQWLNLSQRFSRKRFWPISYTSNDRLSLAAVARQCGLDLRRITQTRHWLIPHVYRDLPIMSLTARELEFPQAENPCMHYVGAMAGKENFRNPRYTSADQQFQAFMERRANCHNPLVYCSFSTFWSTNSKQLMPLIEAFAKRPDLDLVIGLGGNPIADSMRDLPDNILVLEFAPQLEVLRQAAVVITHGGISTINEALQHGVPMLGISGRHVDQNGCLARIQHHGLGVLNVTGIHKADRIMAQLDLMLGDAGATHRQRIREMQAHLADYERDECAVRLLRETAAQQPD